MGCFYQKTNREDQQSQHEDIRTSNVYTLLIFRLIDEILRSIRLGIIEDPDNQQFYNIPTEK